VLSTLQTAMLSTVRTGKRGRQSPQMARGRRQG